MRDWWYRFKCWAWKRYTTVKPRWLPHTWVDRDTQLPHCMFEILGRFIEDELGEGTDESYHPDHPTLDAMVSNQIAAEKEMKELWRWWNEEYLKFDAYELYMAGVEMPQFVREEFTPESCKVTMKCSSEEAHDKWKEACCKVNEADTQMSKELKSRMKRLVDVMDYMWT